MLRRHVLATLAVGVGVTTFFLVTDAGPRPFERPRPPAPIGVFRDGGTPARDPEIERVLGTDFPAVVRTSFAFLGRDTDDGARRHGLTALRASSAFGGHGERLAAAWREMIDSLDHWMTMALGDRGFRASSDELRAHVEVVADQLAAAGLGYTFDASALLPQSKRKVDIVPYRIERVAFVFANSERERVLELRRLERVDPSGLLGRTTEELGDPVVLLDAIDDKIANLVMPVLGGLPFPLGPRTASIAAGEAIRRELAAAGGEPVTRARQLVTASVRHHEAQHGLDADRHLVHPARLAMLVGDKDATAVRARLELSAYLSQIASDMWVPQLTLWSLARHAFHAGHTKTEEMLVAVVVVEGIARELQIVAPGPIFHDGDIDRDRLATLVAPIAAHSTLELRAAAAALWGELFEDKLVRIVD